MHWDVSCIVLAGGRGSRLARDKFLKTVENKTLLQRVINVISSFNSDMIIVAAEGKTFRHLTASPGLRIVTDIYPDKGGLGGLYTGLVASKSFYNLVVASDMPFLNQALLSYIIQLAPGFDAVVARWGDMVEPLHAVYSNSCVAPMEWLLKQGNLKISEVLPFIRVRYVEAQEIARFDPRRLSFFNVNTESDLVKARELARGNRSDVELALEKIPSFLIS